MGTEVSKLPQWSRPYSDLSHWDSTGDYLWSPDCLPPEADNSKRRAMKTNETLSECTARNRLNFYVDQASRKVCTGKRAVHECLKPGEEF